VAASGAERAADRVLSAIDPVAKVVIIVLMAAMVGIVSAEVFCRYVLKNSIGWADEVSRLAFVASIFLAIPLGIRTRSHIGIELFTSRLPARAAALLGKAMAIVAAGVMLLVAYQATRVAVDQWDELMSSVDVSAGFFLVPVAFGTAHSALHLLRIAAFGPYEQTHHVTATE
jgi:TRAP-type C4-dicarboxylate transport system permease small subunit